MVGWVAALLGLPQVPWVLWRVACQWAAGPAAMLALARNSNDRGGACAASNRAPAPPCCCPLHTIPAPLRPPLPPRSYAVVSAIAASALPALVMARGHKIEAVPEVPLVVSDAAGERAGGGGGAAGVLLGSAGMLRCCQRHRSATTAAAMLLPLPRHQAADAGWSAWAAACVASGSSHGSVERAWGGRRGQCAARGSRSRQAGTGAVADAGKTSS